MHERITNRASALWTCTVCRHPRNRPLQGVCSKCKVSREAGLKLRAGEDAGKFAFDGPPTIQERQRTLLEARAADRKVASLGSP